MSCACDTTVFKVQHVKKDVLPFIVSVCVGFSLAAVLHVEGQNVYDPKISNMAAFRGRSLFALWGSDLNSSSQGSGSLCPSPPPSQYVHSVDRKQECGSSSPPSSRMHVLFHSC